MAVGGLAERLGRDRGGRLPLDAVLRLRRVPAIGHHDSDWSDRPLLVAHRSRHQRPHVIGGAYDGLAGSDRSSRMSSSASRTACRVASRTDAARCSSSLSASAMRCRSVCSASSARSRAYRIRSMMSVLTFAPSLDSEDLDAPQVCAYLNPAHLRWVAAGYERGTQSTWKETHGR